MDLPLSVRRKVIERAEKGEADLGLTDADPDINAARAM